MAPPQATPAPPEPAAPSRPESLRESARRAALPGVVAGLLAAALACALPASASVTVRDLGGAFELANGTLTARVNKRTGDLVSLRYRGLECMGQDSGEPAGHWEQDTSDARRIIDAITLDPAASGGRRAEVSVKGVSGGRVLGAEAPGGGTRCDIELRYCLGEGDSGIYAYAIYTHPPSYPADQIGESRFCAKLNPAVFDWMTIDARRNRLMPTPNDWVEGTELNMKEARRLTTGLYKGQVEHKYDYSAVQFDTPAYGWSSTRERVGLWFINPSMEFLSGGPTKVELTGHLDLTDSPDPVLLDYWRGTHYGGSFCPIARGEAWSKVVGPILIYCNADADPQALWRDALRRAKAESTAWPYDWVAGVDYPRAAERGEVVGTLRLDDPGAPLQAGPRGFANLLVGLTARDYRARSGGWPHPAREVEVTWQDDAKHYEFWVRGGPGGRFDIPKVRPGSYVLHAIADGVLGEFAQAGVTVRPGGRSDLGTLDWRPVRFGRQLWDIGVPNRSAREFFHGDDYAHWGLYLEYPKWFPRDVVYTIGRSDFRKDWNFEQVPRVRGGGDGLSPGDPTTWTIRFALAGAPRGRAILRIALCGVGTPYLLVTVNRKRAGLLSDLEYNAVLNRDGIQGAWSEHDVAFDASLLRQGDNTLQLTIPGGSPTNGLEYDYLRLELAPPPDSAK